MRDHVLLKSIPIPVIILVGMAFFISMSLMDVSAQETVAVVEINEDSYSLDVSPDDQGIVIIGVSIRSTVPRNTVYDVYYELVGAPTWTVEVPTPIYMEPLGRKEFEVKVISPLGEPAGKEAELRIWVSNDDNGVTWEGAISGDSCTIVVQPFHRASISLKEDFLTDMDLEGSFDITIANEGNTDSWVGMVFDSDISRFLQDPGKENLEPGETRTVKIDYTLLVENGIETIKLYPTSNLWVSDDAQDVEFVKDNDILHILFKRGPFMILTPQPLQDGYRVKLFVLGGELGNCGIEILDGPEDAFIEAETNFNMANIERKDVVIEFGGFSGSGLITVQGYGFDGSEKIRSNPWTVKVEGEERNDAFLISAPVAVGGGAAAASAIFAGTTAYFYTASEVFKYRWLTLAFVPLYAVAHDEKVLDHFFRGRLFEYIKENPGVTFSALKEHFEVNNGTLTYHLHRLDREELITYRNLGKYKLFYADGVKIKGVEVVISAMDREIVEIISTQPGITTSQVIALLRGERSQRTLSRHLKQLERKGFIKVERSHGARRLYLSGDLERVLMPHQGVIEVSDMTTVEA